VDLEGLYGASFIDWEAVAVSWSKRTVPSRLLLFAARRYLSEGPGEQKADRVEVVETTKLPAEIKAAFATPPDPESEAALLRLLEVEKEPDLLTSLAYNLCMLCTTEGLEPIRRIIVEERDDPQMADLREGLLIVGAMVGYTPPEAEQWRKELAAAEVRRKQRMEAFDRMILNPTLSPRQRQQNLGRVLAETFPGRNPPPAVRAAARRALR